MRQRVSCPYLADVRARWDGELAQERAAGLDTHLPNCASCLEEQRGLEYLAASLGNFDVEATVTQAEHQRLKTALLTKCRGTLGLRVDSQVHNPAQRPHKRAWIVALSGLACAAVAVAILFPVFGTARERASWYGRRSANVPVSGLVDGFFGSPSIQQAWEPKGDPVQRALGAS